MGLCAGDDEERSCTRVGIDSVPIQAARKVKIEGAQYFDDHRVRYVCSNGGRGHIGSERDPRTGRLVFETTVAVWGCPDSV